MGDTGVPWKGVQINIILMGIKQSMCLSKGCILKLTSEVRKTDPATAKQMDEMVYFDDISLGLTYSEAKTAYKEGGNQGTLDKLVERMKVMNATFDHHNLPVKVWMSPSSPQMHELVTGKPSKAAES